MSKQYVNEQVRLVLNGILQICVPYQVYLFGSASEDKFTDQSDLDFLIVTDVTPEELKTIKKKWARLQPLIVHPVDVLWYPKEIFDSKKLIGGVAMIAYEDGKLIYEGTLDDKRT